MVEHGSMQADMVLEKELSILHLDMVEIQSSLLTGHVLRKYEILKTTSIVTHFLQQDHTYSSKVTPNSATSFGYHFLLSHHIPLPDSQRLVNHIIMQTCF